LYSQTFIQTSIINEEIKEREGKTPAAKTTKSITRTQNLNFVNNALSAASSFLVFNGTEASSSAASGGPLDAIDLILVNFLILDLEPVAAHDAACRDDKSAVELAAAWASASVEVTRGRVLM
jgi:hypothetical protein